MCSRNSSPYSKVRPDLPISRDGCVGVTEKGNKRLEISIVLDCMRMYVDLLTMDVLVSVWHEHTVQSKLHNGASHLFYLPRWMALGVD